METGLLIISLIWATLALITSLMTFFQKKCRINDKFVLNSWELLKYVTLALAGYVVGAGTTNV